MLDVVISEFRQFASRLKTEVAKRRSVTRMDPVADAWEFVATDLDELTDKVSQATERLTPAQFARLNKTTAQTVTAWCRAGKLRGAVPNGRSYLIPRGAVAPRRRGAS